MNCVEALVFTAYRAGAVTRDWVVQIFQQAGQAAQAADEQNPLGSDVDDGYGLYSDPPTVARRQALIRLLVPGGLHRYRIDPETGLGGPDIPAGNLVFLDGSAGHVVLSLGTRDVQGRMQVLSMWYFPARYPPGRTDQATTYGFMQVTTVEELIPYRPFRVIEYGTPAWE